MVLSLSLNCLLLDYISVLYDSSVFDGSSVLDSSPNSLLLNDRSVLDGSLVLDYSSVLYGSSVLDCNSVFE